MSCANDILAGSRAFRPTTTAPSKVTARGLMVLALLGAIRELVGTGALFAGIEMIVPAAHAIQILSPDYPGFLIAILPPGAFIALGLLIAGRNWLDARANRRLRLQREHDRGAAATSVPA